MLSCYESDEEKKAGATTRFQLGANTPAQTAHFIHGHLITTLSRSDPLHLRYIYKTTNGDVDFIYVKNSPPKTEFKGCKPRVMLSFMG